MKFIILSACFYLLLIFIELSFKLSSHLYLIPTIFIGQFVLNLFLLTENYLRFKILIILLITVLSVIVAVIVSNFVFQSNSLDYYIFDHRKYLAPLVPANENGEPDFLYAGVIVIGFVNVFVSLLLNNLFQRFSRLNHR